MLFDEMQWVSWNGVKIYNYQSNKEKWEQLTEKEWAMMDEQNEQAWQLVTFEEGPMFDEEWEMFDEWLSDDD
jgi:dihydroorotase